MAANTRLICAFSLCFLLFCVTKFGWGFDNYMAEVNEGKGLKFSKGLKFYFQIILPILILRESMWILAIGVGLIVIRFTYDLWWLFISRVTDRALLENEAVFEAEWKQKTVAIQSEDDGSYYMFGKTRPEKQKKEKKDKQEDKAEESEKSK